MAESEIYNPIPSRLARVISVEVDDVILLGPPGKDDVFVTAARDLRGVSAAEIPHRLGLRPAPSFYVIEFPTSSIQGAPATPFFRQRPCFVGRGRTSSGAREFVIPDQPIPPEATIQEVIA